MVGSPTVKRPLETPAAGDRPEPRGASPSPSPTYSSSSVNKRRHFSSAAAASFRSPPPPLKPSPTEALFRILCPSDRTGGVIGKGGAIVRQLREQTGAKIRIEDAIPGSGDRVIVVVADCQPKKRAAGEGSAGEPPEEEASPVQLTLLRVFERVLRAAAEERPEVGEGGRSGGTGGGEEKEIRGSVVCRLLAPSSQVGCVLGKGGKVVEKIRQESGAQVRVFGNEHVPACAAAGDELIQISGSFSAVKKALLSVSSCLQENPRVENTNFATPKSFSPSVHVTGSLAHMDPYAQRSHLTSLQVPEYQSRGYSTNLVTENSVPTNRKISEEEVIFRMLCSNDKVGSLIGKAGIIIRSLQSETGASIKILDPVPESDERVIWISARESSESRHSQAQDAVLRVHSRLLEAGFDKGSAVSARLLVPAQQIGCLLGKGGAIISEMRRATGASIRIFLKEQVPRCAQSNDEVVQVSGTAKSVQDGLLRITGRIRESIFPPKSFPGVGAAHYTSATSETPPDLLRSGHEVTPLGRYSVVGVSHSTDSSIGFSDTSDRKPPLSHSADHLGIDRVPFPYGSGSMGPRSIHDRPSPRGPRPWAPEVLKKGNPPNLPNMGTSVDYRNEVMGSGNQTPVSTSRTVEVVVPQRYLGFIYGENGSNLADIRELSGASVTIHSPKPGEPTGLVLISGALDQMRNAQSLLHAFVLCGVFKK